MLNILQNTTLRQYLATLALGVLVFSASGLLVRNMHLLAAGYQEMIAVLPYFLLSMVLGLALRFNQGRILAAGLTLIVSYGTMRNLIGEGETDLAAYLYTSLAVCVPLNLLLALLIRERGVEHPHALLLLVLVGLEILVIWLGWLGAPFQLAGLLGQMRFDSLPNYQLSVAATIWVALIMLIMIVVNLRRKPTTAGAITFCLVAFFIQLGWFDLPGISSVMFSAASLFLFMGIVNRTYHLAYRDHLTGLLSRRALTEKLETIRGNYVLAMIDIDRFKMFNHS